MIYNFGAGPAALPAEIVTQIREDLATGWRGTGCSVMEISHRSTEFKEFLAETTELLTQLLNVPKTHTILFLPGGARTQFAMVPLNIGFDGPAQYAITGDWSKLAYLESTRVRATMGLNLVRTDAEGRLLVADLPNVSDRGYLHVCSNETITGVAWMNPPAHPVLVADMSSSLLADPIDVSRYGLIYACAQKNLGIAGITVVILRKDLVTPDVVRVPHMLQYQPHISDESLYNTTPTFPVYVSNLVFNWIKAKGGPEQMQQRARRRSKKLYDFIDSSSAFRCVVAPQVRSTMNVVFQLNDQARTEEFLKVTDRAGLKFLRGHRFVGGIRASMYNSFPEAGVDRLLEVMAGF